MVALVFRDVRYILDTNLDRRRTTETLVTPSPTDSTCERISD